MSPLTRRLILYFLIIILSLSTISGILFLNLGRKSLENSSITYLEKRGLRISAFISNILEASASENSTNTPNNSIGSKPKRKNQSPGKNFIKWMNELLETDIRIVSKDGKLIESALDKNSIDFNQLNESEKTIVNAAFNGDTSYTKESSFLDNESSITLATPIKTNGEIVSVLLLNESNYSPKEFINSGIFIFLISTLAGATLVTLLAIYFSNRFIEPIKKLNTTTKELISGNYNVTSHIDQKDEIGDLAYDLDRLAKRLEMARIETESMEQMRDDFISSMSHELKTPVTVVKSSLEALKAKVITKPEDMEEYHEILYDEMGLMEKLINDLMELNMLRNAKFKMNEEEINILEVLNNSIRSQSLIAQEKNIKIEKNYSEDFYLFHGDYTRLRQLFTIILNNAIKHSKENSEITIYGKKTDGKFTVEIQNFGETIPEESIDQLFQPFYRDKDTEVKGFGLGLAIAKEIANQHHIEILVKSDPGKTSFTLFFPDH